MTGLQCCNSTGQLKSQSLYTVGSCNNASKARQRSGAGRLGLRKVRRATHAPHSFYCRRAFVWYDAHPYYYDRRSCIVDGKIHCDRSHDACTFVVLKSEAAGRQFLLIFPVRTLTVAVALENALRAFAHGVGRHRSSLRGPLLSACPSTRQSEVPNVK